MINRAHVDVRSKKWQKATRRPKSTTRSYFKDVSIGDELWLSALAVLFGMASINGLYPFGLSFIAATAFYKEKCIFVALFSLLGNLIVLRDILFFRYLGSALIFIMAFLILKKTFKEKEYALGILVFLSNFLAGIVFFWLSRGSIYDLFLLAMESTLASIVTFIIPGGIPWVFTQPYYKTERYICFAILSNATLSITQNLQFAGINIRDILGTFFVLLMSLVEGPGAGAVVGIITGITGYTLALSPWIIVLLAFSGLCAGIFSKLGKVGVIGGFSLGYLVYNLYTNFIGFSFIPLVTVGIAYILVLIFPADVVEKLRLFFGNVHNLSQRSQITEQKVRDKLCEIALILEDLGKTFKNSLGLKDDVLRSRYLNSICKDAQFTVCSSCGMYRICWEQETKKMINSFYKLIKSYEKEFPNFSIPQIFEARCNKIEEILKLVEDQSRIYNLNNRMKTILCQNLNLLQDVFKRASKIVRNISYNMPENSSVDKILKNKLLENGIDTDYVYINHSDQRMKINITKSPCKNERQCELLIPKTLKRVVGNNFYIHIVDCPLKTGGSKCRIKAITKGSLGVAVGIAGVAKTGCDVSGDGFSFMELKNGKYLLALSDGMGVGKKAADHSEKTLSLLERLLENGFEPSASIEIVNSAMILLYAGQDGFSTLDLTIVDMYSGETEFIKSGSPATFVKRGSQVFKINSSSLPIGIVDNIRPVKAEKKLRVGDIIIMLTDGVIETFSDYTTFMKYLREITDTNPQEIANFILNMAKDKGVVKDDMTVLVAKVWQRSI